MTEDRTSGGAPPVRPPARALLVAALAAGLAACAQEGDFGRPRPSVWNGLIDRTGSIAAEGRGEPVSDLPFTDDERVLRDRAWRFLMPAVPESVFLDTLANLTRARVLPPNSRALDPEAYFAGLTLEPARSPVSRYRRVSEDATGDARLIPPFADTAARVLAADGQRLRSLPFARSLDDETVRQAALRVGENRCLIAWVRLETGVRTDGYRFALEHLFAETPDAEAAPTERSIAFLARRRALLDPLLPADAAARCGLVPLVPTVAEAPLVVKN